MNPEENQSGPNNPDDKKTQQAKTQSEKTNDIPEPMKQIWGIINSPLVANTALGLTLYWVFDPKGMKQTLSEMKELLEEQSHTIQSLKKQVSRLRKRIGNEEHDLYFDTDKQQESKKKTHPGNSPLQGINLD